MENVLIGLIIRILKVVHQLFFKSSVVNSSHLIVAMGPFFIHECLNCYLCMYQCSTGAITNMYFHIFDLEILYNNEMCLIEINFAVNHSAPSCDVVTSLLCM